MPRGKCDYPVTIANRDCIKGESIMAKPAKRAAGRPKIKKPAAKTARTKTATKTMRTPRATKAD
jgi:BRCT domain type II-containing protein